MTTTPAPSRPPRASVPADQRPKWPWASVCRAHAHARGQWRTRIDGREVSLGAWADDLDGTRALAVYRAIAARADAGEQVDASTLRVDRQTLPMLTEWIAEVERRVERGDLAPRTLEGYRSTARWILRTVPADLPVVALGPAHGRALMQALTGSTPITIGNRVRCTRVWLGWLKRVGFADIDLGAEFKAPTLRSVRRHRRENIEDQWFRREEVHALVAAADPAMQAMILLGVNTGSDGAAVAALRTDGIDFQRALLTQPRPKTGALRRSPLWPETIAALRLVMPRRPGLIFTTSGGRPLIESTGRSTSDALKVRWRVLREQAGVRPLGFRSLKRTFATIAARHPDDLARRVVAGHVVEGVAEKYVVDLPLARFRALSDCVRQWYLNGMPVLPAGGTSASGDGGGSR